MIMKKNYVLFFIACFMSSSVSAQVLWENFEDTRKGTCGFISGSFIPYFENPDKTGVNTSNIAVQYTRNAGELFDVLILDEGMADLSDYISGTKQMRIDVWSPAVGIQITLENDVPAGSANFSAEQYFFDNYQSGTSVSVASLEDVISFTASPNPTQGETTFQDELQNSAKVNLAIYDVTGKLVTHLLDKNQIVGSHQTSWLANGYL
jgi:hypothetical protein